VAWEWFYRLGSPKWFYEKTAIWTKIIGWLALAMLGIGIIWGLAFAPAELKQGNSYRIIYIHVPVAIVAMAGYYVMAISGAIGLIWRMKLSFMVMKSAAPIGAILTFAALFTGAVWGKPTWGTYWVWDARITSMLVLLFLYLGVMALQEAYQNQESADKTCAILALVGMVNIPIIYKSVDWWFTLHQPATLKFTEKSSIAPEMAYPLILMIFAVYAFYAWLLLSKTRVEILHREVKTQWVKETVMEGR
jgi:heme exporter protein C